jgi:hypothetical protein
MFLSIFLNSFPLCLFENDGEILKKGKKSDNNVDMYKNRDP